MLLFIMGLNVQPEGIHAGSLKTIKVPRCEAVTIGFNQDPKFGLLFDKTSTFLVKLRTASDVPASEGNDVSRRAETLGTEQDGFLIEGPGTGA